MRCVGALFEFGGSLVPLSSFADLGAKIVILFEGRDAAGKGGVIKRITERVSPRVFRVVACLLRTNAKNRRCISSATSRIFRRPGRS
jgi:polyphosphate kinase 2 PPK2